MKRLSYLLLVLPALLLLAAVQDSQKTSSAPPSAQQAREQKNLGLRERVIVASLLPWRDPHPVLPLAGFSLDEKEAAVIEAIYAQARAEYAAVSAGADEGVARRDVMAGLYGRIEEYIEQNPDSAWVAGMRLQLGMDRLVNGAYATAANQYKAVWELAGRRRSNLR